MATSRKPSVKKCKEDFTFDKIIGEGSYSTVVLATDKVTKNRYAMKILEKRHIIKEKKVQYVSREKEILARIDHPFFVKLFFTFQDKDNLYFGLSFAERGELLDYLKKVGAFDETATRFYTSEIILALEYLHNQGIIHRDLKPENILLGDDMHIQITDFGTAKIIQPEEEEKEKASSFVGTAEYVSPELLQCKVAYKSSDLWALGCIIYQFLSGRPPFHAANEYLCFQKIIKLEYSIPDGFPDRAKDLVVNLLVLDPMMRLGCDKMGGYPILKDHAFLKGVDWENLPQQTPPTLLPYLPSTTKGEEGMRSDYNMPSSTSEQDFEDRFLQCFGLGDPDVSKPLTRSGSEQEEREKKLKEQTAKSPWHSFVNNELIIKSGLVDKRKGMFSKRRQLILTDAPRLYYVDPVAMVLKGEIPWSSSMKFEQKNFKIFFIHTPNRTYYLEDPTGSATKWVETLNKLLNSSK